MYIGIDLGTSAVKVLLVDELGKVIHTVSKDYELLMPKTNWAEQRPEDWWNQSKVALLECLSQLHGKELKGISFSGQMHGLVILDEFDEVIRPAILWCDQRTQEECDYLNQEIGLDNLISWVGNQALTGFTAPKLLWLKEHEPDNFKRIRKIMLPKDYLQYKLTGVFASDVSDASGTLLLDVEHKQWSKEMMDVIGITQKQLPRLYESFEQSGVLKKELAEEFGIHNEVCIAAGAGDQAAGATGVGVVENGVVSVALGTSGVVFLPCETYSADKKARLHSFAHANGKYHQMGVILSAAGALKWWMEKVIKSHDYKQYIELEAKQAKAENLYFLPYLIGERTPIHDADAKGCFIGLHVTHGKGDMSRAVLEGITFALKDSFEIIKEMNQPIKEIRVSGGGSNSVFWKQLLSDIFQLPVLSIETAQGPAYGAAILAYAAESKKPLLDICNDWIQTAEVYHPDFNVKEYYEHKYEIYHSLYPTLKNVFKKLNV